MASIGAQIVIGYQAFGSSGVAGNPCLSGAACLSLLDHKGRRRANWEQTSAAGANFAKNACRNTCVSWNFGYVHRFVFTR